MLGLYAGHGIEFAQPIQFVELGGQNDLTVRRVRLIKNQDNSHVKSILATAAAERATVAELSGTVNDLYVKKNMLGRATNCLDDVEHFLIPHALKASTDRDFSMWLATAELTLKIAIQQRKDVQEIIAKYGPDTQTIGG